MAWHEVFQNIFPFSVEITLMKQSRSGSMDRFGRIQIEFPDSRKSRLYGNIDSPFEMEFHSFNIDKNSVLHDMRSDSYAFIPRRLTPVSIFTFDGSLDSFFTRMRFKMADVKNLSDDMSMVEFSVAPISLMLGVQMTDIKGFIWVDSGLMKPVKMIASGNVKFLTEEKTPTSLMMDFTYPGRTMIQKDWDDVSTAMKYLQAGRDNDAEQIMRPLENRYKNYLSSVKNGK